MRKELKEAAAKVNLVDAAYKVGFKGNLDAIQLFIDVLNKADSDFIKIAKDNEELIAPHMAKLMEKQGAKWDDFIISFEWIAIEKVNIIDYISSHEENEELKNALIAYCDSHAEKFDLETVTRFIEDR